MKRWSALLLLVLLPLTMAPRTSMTAEPDALEILGNISTQTPRIGQPVSIMLQAKNVSGHTVDEAALTVAFAIGQDAKKDYVLAAVPESCDDGEDEAPQRLVCTLGSLDPGEQATVQFLLRLNSEGRIVLLPEAGGVAALGAFSQPVDEEIPITASTPRRGGR